MAISKFARALLRCRARRGSRRALTGDEREGVARLIHELARLRVIPRVADARRDLLENLAQRGRVDRARGKLAERSEGRVVQRSALPRERVEIDFACVVGLLARLGIKAVGAHAAST